MALVQPSTQSYLLWSPQTIIIGSEPVHRACRMTAEGAWARKWTAAAEPMFQVLDAVILEGAQT